LAQNVDYSIRKSWNAYTYVFNNPLTYTDPSGMIGIKERQWAAGIIAIGAAVWTGGASAGWWAASMSSGQVFAVAMAASFASGAVATQSTKGGLQAAFGAALTFGVASGFDGWQAIAGHAVTGGIMESLQGGQFGHGFAAAGVTALVMPVVHRIDNHVARTTIGAIVGGSLSEVRGGKFANGAMSVAIQAAMSNGNSRRSSLNTGEGSAAMDPVKAAQLMRDADKALTESGFNQGGGHGRQQVLGRIQGRSGEAGDRAGPLGA
jgi:hypothetical protein